MRRTVLVVGLAACALLLVASPAFAQGYSFQVPEETVDAYLESDGTMRLVYRIVFANDPGASPIDFIDLGLPTTDYDLGSVRAWLNGQPVASIEDSEYVSGIAVGLGASAIPAAATGEVVVEIPRVGGVLYAGDEAGTASAKFSPNWFDSQFVHGPTDLTVTFHLPPGVQPDQPRWHEPSGGWPTSTPATGFDQEGRVVYSWRDTSANAFTQYIFGASFPAAVVPEGTLQAPTSGFLAALSSFFAAVAGCSFPLAPFLIIVGLILFARSRSRLAYLPPRISVEGHGIKRGLTAVEAAVLLQTPLDKVLTMILFGAVKKGGARVVQEDPLKIEAIAAPAAELRSYESAFVKAATEADRTLRARAFSDLMIDLVRSVQKKMKGFSLGESRDYYRAIMRKAWSEVEAAGTPEVRSERYAEGLEWLMLDRDFDDRTRRTFTTGPVYVPMWWSNYSPSRPATTIAAPSGRSSPSVSLPHLPGADFAASMARSVQNSAGALVGNVAAFTQGVAKTTNPPPVTRSFGSGGGGGCACACACAGCACACAGGGR